MADRKRLVTLNPSSGAVTTLKDFEDGTTTFTIRDGDGTALKVIPPTRQPVMAQRQRRYGGARTVAESHGNGAIQFRSLIKGASVDATFATAESMLTLLESATLTNVYFEWRPDGATNSVYYDVRGPATWEYTYRWAQMVSGKSHELAITIPVAPLALGDPVAISLGAPTLPGTIALGTAIPGDAPALADVTVRTGNGTGAAPIWALIGWTKRLGTPRSGTIAPWGVIEGESGTLTTWTSTANANYRGGNGAQVTTSGAGTAAARFQTDPSLYAIDDFGSDTVDLEVWARVALDGGVVSPKLTVSAVPNTGPIHTTYTNEYGSTGKLLVRPSTAGVKYRMTRLGTITLLTDAFQVQQPGVDLAISASWAAGSTGAFGLDYVMIVPARSRALSPTGKPNDSAYPDFIPTTAATVKDIRGLDLSGRSAPNANTFRNRDTGLGGSIIELPPGNVDMLIKLSSLVPDDPTSDTTTEQLAHTLLANSQLYVWPRYWIARGA